MATAKKRARTQQKYYRNLRNVPVAWRFAESERKINLAPRGQRGDLAPIKKGEQQEVEFINNTGLIFEVVTAEEAKLIAEKQDTNIQRRAHPALQQIRNQRGEEYGENPVVVEQEINSQGKTVAPLDDQGQIEFEDRGISREGNTISGGVAINRGEFPGSEQNPIPTVPDSVNPEDQAEWVKERRQELLDQAELDAEAHRKAITERPDEDYLAELRTKKS